jgi:hypothetical protein
MSLSPDNKTDPTKESQSAYYSVYDCDINLRMKDDTDAPYYVDLDGDVDM